VTPNAFRKLALALPGASEGEHMGHPDFRAGGRIFASLTADGECGMVKVSPAEQRALVRADPEAFEPAAGAWGRSGCTMVTLAAADAAEVRAALHSAHSRTAAGKPRRR
jgi:hypothetical protein